MKIELTPRERFGLESILGTQGGEARDYGMVLLFAVLKKLKVTTALKRSFARLTPAGWEWDDSLLAMAEPYAVDLEPEEVAKAKEMVANARISSPYDLEWWSSLKEKLSGGEIENPALKGQKKGGKG